MVFHEVLSLETPFPCVIPVLFWYLVGFCCVLMCYRGHWFGFIWDYVWHTLGWLS